MKIINAKDMFSKEFIPTYPYYEVIYTREKFAALGIDGVVMYRMDWDDLEDYFVF